MFMGMLLSPAPMIWSRTVLAESTRSCKSDFEAAKAVEDSKKQRLSEASIFFIPKSFRFRGPFKAPSGRFAVERYRAAGALKSLTEKTARCCCGSPAKAGKSD